MTGAICPLEEMCDIAHAYGALTFVDEVRCCRGYYTIRLIPQGTVDNNLGPDDRLAGPKALDTNYRIANQHIAELSIGSGRGAHTKNIPSHPIVVYHEHTIVNTTTT